MASGMIGDKRCVGSAWGWRGQGCPLFSAQGARAHKTLNLLQSAIGVFKIEGRVSGAPLYSWKAGSIRRSTTTPVTVGARWRMTGSANEVYGVAMDVPVAGAAQGKRESEGEGEGSGSCGIERWRI